MKAYVQEALLLLPLLGAAAVAALPAASADPSCAPTFSPGKYPTWQQLPTQTTMPDPFLPLSRTTTDGGASAADVMAGRAAGRVASPDEWRRCRRPEILALLQEYQYGWYPDRAAETVKATRSGTTVNIEVAGPGAKTGKFKATVSLPSGASAGSPAPVVINIGGMQNQPYLQAGIAVVGFDYTSVAADSNSKTGAFWDIYKGRDIGGSTPVVILLLLSLLPCTCLQIFLLIIISFYSRVEILLHVIPLLLWPPSQPTNSSADVSDLCPPSTQASSRHGPGASTARSTR